MKKDLLNAEAIKALVCALCSIEFSRVCNCSTAKEISNFFKVTHEGTNQVKELKLDFLKHEYELFQMENDESIKDMSFRL